MEVSLQSHKYERIECKGFKRIFSVLPWMCMPFGVNNAHLNDDKYLIAHVAIFYPHPKSSHKMRVGLSFVYTGLHLGIL